jgi:hypothetical protein
LPFIKCNLHRYIAAYRLLYAAAQDTPYPLTQELRRLSIDLGEAALRHPLVKHAMDVSSAKSSGNFHKFFRLYAAAPRMASYLMELMLPGMRRLGLRAMLRAHSPTVSAEWVADALGFASADDDDERGDGGASDGEEFRAYMAEQGCVLVDAPAATSTTPGRVGTKTPPQLLIDTRLSLAADVGPARPTAAAAAAAAGGSRTPLPSKLAARLGDVMKNPLLGSPAATPSSASGKSSKKNKEKRSLDAFNSSNNYYYIERSK